MDNLFKKHWAWIIAIIIILVIVVSFIAFKGDVSLNDDEVAIRVNNETFTYRDFNNMSDQVAAEMQMFGAELSETELKDRVTEMIIQQVLLGQLAEEKGIEISSEEIDDYFYQMMERAGYQSEEDFVLQLEMQGIEGREEINELLELEMRVEKIIDAYKTEVEITEEDLEIAYQEYSQMMGEDTPSFEELEDQLRDSLIQEKVTPLVFTELDRLREEAEVEIFIEKEDVELEEVSPEAPQQDFEEIEPEAWE